MTVSSFRQVLEALPRQATQKELQKQFKEICQDDHERISMAMEQSSPDDRANIDDALRGHNYDLNRYCDVLPFNHNRVRLQGKSDYINASHILLPPSISPNKYVATQGPLNHSIADFWRMTWEQGSVCIVMLANPVEKSRNKCAVYWPQQVGRAMKAGDVTVTLVDERPLSACLAVVVRKLSLVHRSHAGEPRVVTQLHYTEWPDEGVPVSPVPILTMIKELRTTISPSPAVPVVIHCSAGVGRTGTFIVLDAATEYFSKNRDYPGDFTLDCVKSLRKQRTMTVQTFVQFMFCYQVIDYMLLDMH